MSSARKIDVTSIIDKERLGLFRAVVLGLLGMFLFMDGFDSVGIGFAAPHIARDWHIAPSSFGTVFALGPVGMLFGGVAFGIMGDSSGRKPAILLSTLCFGVAILATPFCTSLNALGVVRFISGLGIGGLFPLGLVLSQEFMPRHFRSTGTIISNSGYSLGTVGCGLIAASLIPRFGWPIVFWLGGGVAVLLCIVGWLWLPESIKFLVVKNRRPDLVARTLKRLKPGASVTGEDKFVLSGDEPLLDHARHGASALRPLFAGRLAYITPLLWLSYVGSSTTVFFLALWGPILGEALGVKPAHAAIASSASSFGGLIAALLLGRFIDRLGAIVIFVMPLIAAPAIASLGLLRFSDLGYILAMFTVGFFAVGGHAGLHSVASIFYPSVHRSNGTGWALSASRIGTIGGPYIGGLLLSAHMPLKHVFFIAATPSIVFATSIFCLGLLHRRVLEAEAKSRITETSAMAVVAGNPG